MASAEEIRLDVAVVVAIFQSDGDNGEGGLCRVGVACSEKSTPGVTSHAAGVSRVYFEL